MSLEKFDLTPKPSKDNTLILSLQEEKLLKRIRQVETGAFTVITIDCVPVIIVVNGKPEVLSH